MKIRALEPCLRSLSNRFPHSFSLVSCSLPMRLMFFPSVSFVSFTMVKLFSHHGEIIVSPWWNSCLTTMKLTLYTCVNDAQHVRKECGIREKRMRNTWKRNAGTGGKRFANRWNVNVLPLKQMFFDRTVIVSCNISWFYYHPLVNLLESLTEFVNPYREVKLLDFIGLEYSYHKNGW